MENQKEEKIISTEPKVMKLIHIFYIITIVSGIISVILSFLNLDSTPGNNYNYAYKLCFDGSIGGLRYLFLFAIFFPAIFLIFALFDYIPILINKDLKKGIKITKKEKLKNTLLTNRIYLIVQLALALYSFIVIILIYPLTHDKINLNLGILIPLSIFSLITLTSVSIGEFILENETYRLTIEMIEEKEKEKEEKQKNENKKDNKKDEHKEEIKEEDKSNKLENNNSTTNKKTSTRINSSNSNTKKTSTSTSSSNKKSSSSVSKKTSSSANKKTSTKKTSNSKK